jgi:hypothetical protein
LSKITFKDADVNTGKTIFVNGTGNPLAGGTCAFCHGNAGALSAFFGNENLNFNTNVEGKAISAFGNLLPRDGGFGTVGGPLGSTVPPIGNGTFNTASVVEAADTPPFFHNNVVDTLEGVVRFYGDDFNDVQLTGATRFSFNETQIKQLANFMRAVNTLQNIDVASRELEEVLAIQGNPRGEQDTRLQLAFGDTQDAIDVLTDALNPGGLFPASIPHLIAARDDLVQALRTPGSGLRRGRIKQAIRNLTAARGAVATILP